MSQTSTSSRHPETPNSKQRYQPPMEVHSTPFKPKSADSFASGVHEAGTNVKVVHVPSWTNNLEHHAQCDIQQFLKYFLFQCRKDKDKNSQLTAEERNSVGQQLLDHCLEKVLPLSNSKGLKDRLDEYCSAKHEEAQYSQFVRTFNYALEELRKLDDGSDFRLRHESELSIMFDPNVSFIVRGAHHDVAWTHDKPDTVTMAYETAREDIPTPSKQDGNQNAFAGGYADEEPPEDSTLNWARCLCVEELMFSQTPLKKPPLVYSKTLNPVPAPRYRVTNECIELVTADVLAVLAEPVTVPQDASVTATKTTGKLKKIKSQPAVTMRTRQLNPRNAKSAALVMSENRAVENGRMDEDEKRNGKRKVKASLSGSPSKKFKSSSTPTDAPDTGPPWPPLRCALYGPEMLNRGLWATHAITLLIIDDTLWLWWYDREDTIQSTGINFVQNLPYFLVLLTAFQRFDLEDWGTQSDMFHESNSEFKLEVEGVTSYIDPNDDICSSFSLHGRDTRLMGARIESEPEKKFVLKSSWPEISRTNEVEIIKRAVEMGESDPYIKGHLPELVASRDLDYSTGSIREFLYHGDTAGKIHPRILRMSLFRRLEPIEELDGNDFLNAWLDCRRCHFRLWLHGIEHGDISMANLMVNPDTNAGILNDYDLAVIREGVRTPSGSERMGTIPFMAMDLLCDEFFDGKIVRQYRHDSESFIWVLMVKALTGHPKYGHWVDAIQTAYHVRCLDNKRSFLAEHTHSWIPGDPMWLITCELTNWLHANQIQRDDARKEAARRAVFWGAAEPKPEPEGLTQSEFMRQACEEFGEFERKLKEGWELAHVGPTFALLPEWFMKYPPITSTMMPAPQS